MLDSFIVIGVTLIGLVVVYFMFQNIKSLEVTVVVPKERSARPRRARASPPSNNIALDKEAEALIARELTRQPTGMRSDIRTLQPEIIKDTRVAPTAATRGKAQQAADIVIPEKQVLIDKELGFQRVTKQPKERRNVSPGTPAVTTQVEEMDRKLSQFFSNSNRRNNRLSNISLKDEPPAAASGAYVIVRKDISNARKW